MIPTETIRRLLSNISLSEETKKALENTLRLEEGWRSKRGSNLGQHAIPSHERKTPIVSVSDCAGSEVLPGRLIAHPEQDGDGTEQRAYLTTTRLALFYRNCFRRNSVDGKGGEIPSSVHFSRSYCNAYWSDDRMVYGDGDGLMFLDFTASDDFIGHELTHGVTQYSAALGYSDEPGALNESISDVFGSMFRQWNAGQTVVQADWKIGRDLMGPTARGLGWECVRDLADPESAHSLTKQPSDYREYIPNGDPHDNSGIPNHAFF
jgi:Zn-dependent metalloprotease